MSHGREIMTRQTSMSETMDKIHELLINRAGLTDEIIEKGTSDLVFEFIVHSLTSIHQGKEVLYGKYLETHGAEPENFCLIQHFCDTKRKYIRAENFIKIRSQGEDIDINELLDTYCDLSIYAAMGVQLILHLMERDNEPEST